MKSKTQTSKKLMWTIMIFYMLSVWAVGLIKTKFNVDLESLLTYVLPMAMTVLGLYFGKSSFENYNIAKTGVDIANLNQIENNENK